MTTYSAPNNNNCNALATTKHESEAMIEQGPIQPNSPAEAKMNLQQHSATPTDIDHDYTSDDDETLTDDSILPNPTMANVMDIKEFLEDISTADREAQQELNQCIVDEKYINKLVSLLVTCEKSKKTSCLPTIRSIILNLMSRYDANIIEEMLKNSSFVGCLGILEYDPNLEGKAQYRQMFSRVGMFKEVVPIDDPDTMNLINQVVRLQFLKDKVLADTLEVDAISVVNLVIMAKALELVQDIAYDRQLMKDLFDILKNPSEPKCRRNDVVLFVHQLCTVAKKSTIDVYRKLCPAGLFDLLEFAFVSFDDQVKQAGIEIMQMALETNPHLIRAQCVEQATRKGSKVFLDALVIQTICERNVTSMSQFVDAIQALLDINPEKPEKNSPSSALQRGESADNDAYLPDSRAEAFLELFYTQYFSILAEPLLLLMNDSIGLDRPTYALCEKICKIVTFLVQQHPSRLKALFTSNGLAGKIALLVKNNEKDLHFAALNFFRTCMDLGDEYFIRMLVRTRVIHIVIDLLQNTKSNNNPMNLACLEFFEHIREKKIKLLVLQCGTIHKETMKGLRHIPLFKHLVAMHAGKGDCRATLPSSQAVVDSGLSDIPIHSPIPHFKDIHKARRNVTGGSSSSGQNRAGSVKSPLMELFGDDDDDSDASEINLPQPNQLRRKLQETDFEETESRHATNANDFSSGKRAKVANDTIISQWMPINLPAISLPPSPLSPTAPTKSKSKLINKRRRDDEVDADLREAVDRAQPRRKLDAAQPGSH